MTLPELTVFVGAPDAFAPRAEWVLATLLAPLGRRVAVTRDPAAASGAALAYAAEPVAGVPTIPCDAGAMELIAAGRPLPAGAFAACGSGDGAAVAAWPADPGAGFAVPFDLVASAFVLLACWDERTTAERDKYGRLPFSASVFAANPELKIDEPAVDRYAELLRGALAPRLAELGLEPLAGRRERLGSARPLRGRAHPRPRQPVALDQARLRRRRLPHRPRGPAPARAAPSSASSATAPTGCVRHLPRRTDPFWTFPQILHGEDVRGVSLDLLRDRPPHAQAGRQPAGDVPHAHPRGPAAGHRRRPRGRPARQRRRPARARRVSRGPREPLRARGPLRHRHPLPLPARPLPRDAAAAGAGRVHLRHHAWRSPSTRASAAAARSRSARTRWRRSGPWTSSSCRSR